MALAATILHAAFISLHVAMMAALAFAGDANASTIENSFVICAPRKTAIPDSVLPDGSNGGTGQKSGNTATFCPVCTGGAAPALILPVVPFLPAYTALDVPAPVAVTPVLTTARHETEHKQSRAPPHLT